MLLAAGGCGVKELKTLWAVRIKRDKVRFWRELWSLLLILLGVMAIPAMMMGAQYYICRQHNPKIKFAQCIRHEWDWDTKK